MNIQEYPIIERAVYAGVATGVEHLLSNVSDFNNPEVVVETISNHVMKELCEVIDFGQTALRFTPDMMHKLWQAQAQEPSPTPPNEKA